MSIRSTFLLTAILLILAFLLWPSAASPPTHSTTTTVRVYEDSVQTRFLYQPSPLHVHSKLKSFNDRFTLDTILNTDTLHIELASDSSITIRLLPAPRQIEQWVKYMRRDSLVFEREPQPITNAWYESPLLVIVGAILGFIIALIL